MHVALGDKRVVHRSNGRAMGVAGVTGDAITFVSGNVWRISHRLRYLQMRPGSEQIWYHFTGFHADIISETDCFSVVAFSRIPKKRIHARTVDVYGTSSSSAESSIKVNSFFRSLGSVGSFCTEGAFVGRKGFTGVLGSSRSLRRAR